MAKVILKISTPVGTFTRKTSTAYTHAVVRVSPRAQQALTQTYTSGVHGRWIKDRGFATTWHSSEAAALKAAAAPYMWDGSTTVVGVYPVNGGTVAIDPGADTDSYESEGHR